MMKMRAIV